MRRIFTIAFTAAGLAFGSTVALAEDSCTWSTQPDGSQWGTCVDNNGNTYCESCPAGGGPCSVVSCSS